MDQIHGYPRRSQLLGQIFGQVNQAGIADTGADVGTVSIPGRQATDVDDSSPALLDHVGAHGTSIAQITRYFSVQVVEYILI